MQGVGISKLKVTPLIFPTFLLQQFLPNQQQTNIPPQKKICWTEDSPEKSLN